MKFGVNRHGLVFLAASVIALIPATPALADNKVWTRVRTVQGCFVYWQRGPELPEAEFLRNNSFSYEGTGCAPNAVLNGNGVLTILTNTRSVESGPRSTWTEMWRGRFGNGVPEGEFHLSSGPTGDLIPEYIAHFIAGCPDFKVEEGLCTPFSGSRFAGGSSDASADSTSPQQNSASSAPESTPASDATEEVFGRCIAREGPVRSGITYLYHLRNVCQSRISFSYCLRASYEAAGDFNLCSRREYKTHSVAPGERIHFTFSLMPEGTPLSDGRTVGPNALQAVGHACTNDNSPGVYFRDGRFLSTGC